jgi:hypothetical protein
MGATKLVKLSNGKGYYLKDEGFVAEISGSK